jgi:hypothetical protein
VSSYLHCKDPILPPFVDSELPVWFLQVKVGVILDLSDQKV